MHFILNFAIGFVATFIGTLICYLTGTALSGKGKATGPDRILLGLFAWALAGCAITFVYCIGMAVRLIIQ